MKQENLGKGFCVYTDDVNTFSADPLLLAGFANVNENDNALDLCTGCGIVALLLCKKGCENVTAVEINEEAAGLARLSAKESKADMAVITQDVREFANCGKAYSLITANPPYFKESRSPVRRRNEIRSELLLKPEELFFAANKLLSQDGEFCFCHLYSRLSELTGKLTAAGLNIHRLRTVRSEKGKAPYLFLASCRKTSCDNISQDEVILSEMDWMVK